MRGELALQIRQVRILAPGFLLLRRLFQIPDQPFRIPDVQVPLLDDLQGADLLARKLQGKERPGMSGRDLFADQGLPGRLGKLQQPDRVGDGGAVLPDAGGDLLL